MQRPQTLRGDDRVRGVQVKQRDRYRDERDEHAKPAGEPVGVSFFLLDELLSAVQRIFADSRTDCSDRLLLPLHGRVAHVAAAS